MKELIINILKKYGLLIIKRKTLHKNTPPGIAKLYDIDENSVPLVQSVMNSGIRQKLINEGRTRWLEVGCGGTFDEYFTYIDLFPETLVQKPGKYYRIDILNLTEKDIETLGKFDLVRMQHVLEHFSPEDGLRVLDNCARLLQEGGFILITTPDLKKFISIYLNGTIRNDFNWALKRISPDSPDSFFFSMYAHSMRYEEHKWCYDAEGLIYQLKKTGKFKNIWEIKLSDDWANVPFTHNRPKEDVCVIGQIQSE